MWHHLCLARETNLGFLPDGWYAMSSCGLTLQRKRKCLVASRRTQLSEFLPF